MPHKLGRIYVPDTRDFGYPMSRILKAPLPVRTSPWTLGPILDQGETPRCVAFAWRGWKNSEPILDPLDQPPSDEDFYRKCQAIDGSSLPHDGTTVRAGASLMRHAGRMGEYVWAKDEVELAAWVRTHSPAVMGTNWYSDMDRPANGIMSVSGNLRGGHAYLCYWYDLASEMFLCQNSWGSGWGRGGLFAIPYEGMRRLLRENGEACGAVEIEPLVTSWREKITNFLRGLMKCKRCTGCETCHTPSTTRVLL